MLLHNHPEYVSCACGYNAVNYDAKSLTITIFLLLPRPFLLRPVPISLGYIMESFLSPVYPRWRSQRSRLAPKYARPAR